MPYDNDDEDPLDFDEDTDLSPIQAPAPPEQSEEEGASKDNKKASSSHKSKSSSSRRRGGEGGGGKGGGGGGGGGKGGGGGERPIDPLYCSYDDYLQALRRAGLLTKRHRDS